MTRSPQNLLLGLALSLVTGAAQAGPFFSTTNQGAFARSFLLPALGETGVLLTGDWNWRAQLDLSNDYHFATAGNESITLDGESARLSYVLTQGLDNGLEWSIELPLLHQGGGFMDGFIENWHDWFGLPNGGRELAPQSRYLYQVMRDSAVIYQNTEKGLAMGDIRVNGGWQWRDGVMLRAAAQLPTGDDKKLAGENAGAALWADAALPFAAGSSWRGFVSLGASAADESKILPGLQEQAVGFGGIGLSWAWSESLRFTTQLYAHTPLYRDTELEALKRPGLQVSFGGSYLLLPNVDLRLAVQEDAITTSSPDFSAHIALRLTPPR